MIISQVRSNAILIRFIFGGSGKILKFPRLFHATSHSRSHTSVSRVTLLTCIYIPNIATLDVSEEAADKAVGDLSLNVSSNVSGVSDDDDENK